METTEQENDVDNNKTQADTYIPQKNTVEHLLLTLPFRDYDYYDED